MIVARHCGIKVFGISIITDLGGFDEVQMCPQARQAIKYLVAEGKEFHYKGDGEWEESKGVAKLGELEDVEFTEDPRNGSVLVKQDDRWIPASEMFIPTGEMTDGTAIKTFDDLVGFIVSMSGGDKVWRLLHQHKRLIF